MGNSTYPKFEIRYKEFQPQMNISYEAAQDGKRFRIRRVITTEREAWITVIYGVLHLGLPATKAWADQTWVSGNGGKSFSPGNGRMSEAVWRLTQTLGEAETRRRYKIPPLFPVTKEAAFAQRQIRFHNQPQTPQTLAIAPRYDFGEDTPPLPFVADTKWMSGFGRVGEGVVAGYACQVYRNFDRGLTRDWSVERRTRLVLRSAMVSGGGGSRVPATATGGYEVTALRFVNALPLATFQPPPGSLIYLPATMADEVIPPGCRRAAMRGSVALTGFDFPVSFGFAKGATVVP